MARYIQDIYLGQPTDFVEFMMKDYLDKNSFSEKIWYGSPVNRKARGFFEVRRFMVWSYSDGTLHLEAWIQGPFGGEQTLTGLWGWVTKVSYRREIKKLIGLLQQQLPEPSASGDAAPDSPASVKPIKVQTWDNRSSAILTLVFGLASIILPIVLEFLPDTALDRHGLLFDSSPVGGFYNFWPYSTLINYSVSLILGYLAIKFYRSSKNSTKADIATVGLGFAIFGMLYRPLLYIGAILLLRYLGALFIARYW